MRFIYLIVTIVDAGGQSLGINCPDRLARLSYHLENPPQHPQLDCASDIDAVITRAHEDARTSLNRTIASLMKHCENSAVMALQRQAKGAIAARNHAVLAANVMRYWIANSPGKNSHALLRYVFDVLVLVDFALDHYLPISTHILMTKYAKTRWEPAATRTLNFLHVLDAKVEESRKELLRLVAEITGGERKVTEEPDPQEVEWLNIFVDRKYQAAIEEVGETRFDPEKFVIDPSRHLGDIVVDMAEMRGSVRAVRNFKGDEAKKALGLTILGKVQIQRLKRLYQARVKDSVEDRIAILFDTAERTLQDLEDASMQLIDNLFL